MKQALHNRNGIPFFYDKSETEFAKDNYEKYDPSVIRQCVLHLSDELWGRYPVQEVLDLLQKNFTTATNLHVLELGCSVGRMIGEIALHHPDAECWGIDYSYQLLKKAKETWIDGDDTELRLGRYGFSDTMVLKGKSLKNLNFGLARAEELPFADSSQDVVFSSFLLDRLKEPLLGLKEMNRVLKPSGTVVIVSPLNFIKSAHWDKFYPPIKLFAILDGMGFIVEDWVEDLNIIEPLDTRGNAVHWNCVALVLSKK